MKKLCFFMLIILQVLIVSGCGFDFFETEDFVKLKNNESDELSKKDMELKPETAKERQWTILVYMSADNNLESSALLDLDEMEKSGIDTDEVTVLVLMDRSPSFDSSNDNWYKTRMFKLKSGKKSELKEIWSEEIECPKLGLSLENEKELDMSSYGTLSKSLEFMYEDFPALHYGLILWGHGEGWRGFCYDGTSGTGMSLYQLKMGLNNGLNGKKLDFIGFDTCFSGEIEVMYQIREFAGLGIGVEGLMGLSGWNYRRILDDFNRSGSKRASDFSDAVIQQFSRDYETVQGCSISAVNLGEMELLNKAFSDICGLAGQKITDAAKRDEVKNVLLNKTVQFLYEEEKKDLHIDIGSISKMLGETFLGKDPDFIEETEKFNNALAAAVNKNWSSSGLAEGIGVFFSVLTAGNLLAANHPVAYIKGGTANQIEFVQTCDGYVPTGTNGGSSLLDRVFYTLWR